MNFSPCLSQTTISRWILHQQLRDMGIGTPGDIPVTALADAVCLTIRVKLSGTLIKFTNSYALNDRVQRLWCGVSGRRMETLSVFSTPELSTYFYLSVL